jgi:hypothetical protein
MMSTIENPLKIPYIVSLKLTFQPIAIPKSTNFKFKKTQRMYIKVNKSHSKFVTRRLAKFQQTSNTSSYDGN